MHTWAFYNALIVAGYAMDTCLCIVLFTRRRFLEFPALLGFVLLDLASSILLPGVARSGNRHLYARLYLGFDIASFLLQAAILYEIAKHVLRPTGIWTRAAFKPLFLISLAGAFVAGVSTFLLQPAGLSGPESFELRADMFTGLLTCEIVIAMMISAKEVGLGWRNHVMAVGQGLMFWCLTVATVEGVSLYLGPRNPYLQGIYYARSVAYLAVLGYWSVSLWRDEPERKPISPALRKYVLALHERVHYDLGKVGH